VDYLVVEARYLGGYTVWLRFRRVAGGALEWPNGASFAPEFLHDNIRVAT
jgi:hypothetical protein